MQVKRSAILSTFIKLPVIIKIFVLSILSGRFTQVLHENLSMQNKRNIFLLLETSQKPMNKCLLSLQVQFSYDRTANLDHSHTQSNSRIVGFISIMESLIKG